MEGIFRTVQRYLAALALLVVRTPATRIQLDGRVAEPEYAPADSIGESSQWELVERAFQLTKPQRGALVVTYTHYLRWI